MTSAPLGSLNLNLLRTLDVLLDETNVTRAAERLGVTQSAVSHALRQLRQRIGDPLLVREGLNMRRTPRADALRAPLRRGLVALGQALEESSEFDASEATGQVVVAAPEDLALIVLPRLAARLEKVAPALELRWRPLHEAPTASEHAAGGIDLSLLPGAPTGDPARSWAVTGLERRRLYRERVVCVMREHHPMAAHKLSSARFLAARHVRCGSSASAATADVFTRAGGVRDGAHVRSPALAAELVASSDMLWTVPQRLASHFAARHRLVLRPFPLADLRYKVRVHWHPSVEQDAMSRMLRDELLAVID